MIETNKFYNLNNMEGLNGLEANSIDCMITDPPYGYSFMNKGWDKVLPPIATWKECLRVLKPGSFAFVMSAPRQDVLSRMIINLEDAGFKTGFTSIYWTYATGFPKAGNVGKMVDKRLGEEREVICESNRHGGGSSEIFPERGSEPITEPASPEAKALDGSYTGFQPKPAVEVIIVVMKPLNKSTYIDQALDNGKGITWFDDCRVPYQSDNDKPLECTYQDIRNSNVEVMGENMWTSSSNKPRKVLDGKMYNPNQSGRFPANLLVSDDVLNDGNITKGTGGISNLNPSKANKQVYGFKDYKNMHTSGEHYNDEGSFSRYFDLDSWWQKNITDLPYEVQKTFPWLIVPKASSSEKNEGLDKFEIKNISDGRLSGKSMGIEGKGQQPQQNIHPTVKPLKLMSYLITLGSRPNDIILDPYGGSGTTGIAAYRLKRQFILFESEPKYHEIAKARLNNEEKKKGGFDKW